MAAVAWSIAWIGDADLLPHLEAVPRFDLTPAAYPGASKAHVAPAACASISSKPERNCWHQATLKVRPWVPRSVCVLVAAVDALAGDVLWRRRCGGRWRC